MSGLYEVAVRRDVVFAEIDQQALRVDIHRPDTPVPPPAVVYVHGGAWMEGDKADGAATRISALAAHGVAVVSMNYRLGPAGVYPAAIHDAKAAIRWVRAHGAEHGLATDRVGIWGASAGGYLATMVGLTGQDPQLEGRVGADLGASSTVDAVVDWFGQSDLVASSRRAPLENRILAPAVEPPFLGLPSVDDPADREFARSVSPLARVTAAAPPFLIAHGDRDRVTPVSESAALHDALVRVGASSTLLLVGGGGHEGVEFDEPALLAMTAAFLRAHLG